MKRFFQSFTYILIIHLCGLIGLSLLRLALFIANHFMISEAASKDYALQSIAFLRGLWFDNVIACYISLLPLAAITIAALFDCGGKKLLTPITVFMQTLFGAAFAISAANIPYFQYFFKNINSSIYNWFEYGFTTLGLVFGEPSYYPPMILFIVFLVLFVWITNRIKRNFIKRDSQLPKIRQNWKGRLAVGLTGAVLTGLCIFGIRGRTGYNPIKVSAAYYCEDPFLNQLGVNAAFNLLSSSMDDMRPENKSLHLMNEEQAVANMQKWLERAGNDSISPIYEYTHEDGCDIFRNKRPNVVIIFMESMSASLMKTFGQDKNLTPFLDSLFHQSVGFTNAYSAGIHTNHGLYATLYSFPAIMKRNLMKGSVIPVYSGLPTILKGLGYQNMFFMTHESQYDNMNAFFRTNGYDEIFSQEDYPKEKIVNSFGVQDDFLYSYALNVINQRSQTRKPFFASILSISNHPPFIIPNYFHPQSKDKEDQIVEYSDWALKQFFAEAKKQPWFENTIFVLEADHGKLVGDADNEMPISYNHIPLMFYSPKLQPQLRDDWAMQIDIQPTLLGLMGISYPQNNFGINLLKKNRSCACYTADNMIGARSQGHLYIYCPDTKQEFLYRLSDNGKHSERAQADTDFEYLKTHLFSLLQAAECLVTEGKTVNYPKKTN